MPFGPSNWGNLVQYFIIYGVGFILGSFGGMFSECSGIINIALEGSMVFGAYSGIAFMTLVGQAASTSWLVTTTAGWHIFFLLAALVSILFSILFSFLLSFVSIRFKADQTVVGTALNTVAIALCTIVNTSLVSKKDSPEIGLTQFNVQKYLNLTTGNTFVDKAFSGITLAVLFGIIMIAILWICMNKTRFGLRLRACGENPAAADSVGINVNRMRYLGTAIGSSAAGLGGFIIFSFSASYFGNWQIDALGYGFLVLAIEIFGNWKTNGIFLASLFFAFFFAFAPTFTAYLGTAGMSGNFFGKKPLYYMLPYLFAFLTLIVFSKRSHAPKAEGIPYDKSSR